jgi:hypothetical protein
MVSESRLLLLDHESPGVASVEPSPHRGIDSLSDYGLNYGQGVVAGVYEQVVWPQCVKTRCQGDVLALLGTRGACRPAPEGR